MSSRSDRAQDAPRCQRFTPLLQLRTAARLLPGKIGAPFRVCIGWAGVKPWMLLEQYAGAGHIPESVEPLELARLYDYALRETDAYDPPRTAKAAGDYAAARAALPRLVVSQRQARRLIEQHPHFADVFLIWQEHSWNGDGYAYHVTLPAAVPHAG